jgi:hypothetical protein
MPSELSVSNKFLKASLGLLKAVPLIVESLYVCLTIALGGKVAPRLCMVKLMRPVTANNKSLFITIF